MLVQDDIHIATWLGSLPETFAKQTYKALRPDATALSGLVSTHSNTRLAAAGLERAETYGHRRYRPFEKSEGVARRVYLAFKSDAAAKALDRSKTHVHDGYNPIESQCQASSEKVDTHKSLDSKKQDEVERNEETRRDGLDKKFVEEIYDDVLELAAVYGREKRDSVFEDTVHEAEDPDEKNKTKQDGDIRRDTLLGECLGQTRDGVLKSVLESRSAPEKRLRLLQEPDATPREIVQLPEHKDLQSCNQLQAQISKLRTAEKPSCAGTESTTHEDEASSPYKDVLSKVTFTESPSFAAWVPCDLSDIQHMKLSKVSFRGCEQSGLTFMSTCELERVTFINCKFDGAAFCKVTMSNVTFSDVEFTDSTFYWMWLRKVRVSRLHFNNDVWCTTYLEKALISEDSLLLKPGTTRDYGLRAIAASSKTRYFVTKCPVFLDALKRKLGRETAFTRHVYLLQPASTDGILTRLAKHETIIDRIMQYCFPGSSVHIYEYPDNFQRPACPKRYKKACLDYQVLMKYPVKLFGSLQPDTPALRNPFRMPRRGVGNCTCLLWVNKHFYNLASRYLYSRTFHFQCSAYGVKDFLSAHSRQTRTLMRMKMIKKLVLYYHWREDKLMFSTDTRAWGHLLASIRHEFSFIPSIRIQFGPSFWDFNKLSSTATGVLNNPMFWGVHKLAAPADRWEIKNNQSTHRADGTVLEIDIGGTETQEQIDFVRQLVDEIEKERVGRPLFVRSPEGKEITYRCADQFR
jgi:hypothetical protein